MSEKKKWASVHENIVLLLNGNSASYLGSFASLYILNTKVPLHTLPWLIVVFEELTNKYRFNESAKKALIVLKKQIKKIPNIVV